jgi:hypothetical protein
VFLCPAFAERFAYVARSDDRDPHVYQCTDRSQVYDPEPRP